MKTMASHPTHSGSQVSERRSWKTRQGCLALGKHQLTRTNFPLKSKGNVNSFACSPDSSTVEVLRRAPVGSFSVSHCSVWGFAGDRAHFVDSGGACFPSTNVKSGHLVFKSKRFVELGVD